MRPPSRPVGRPRSCFCGRCAKCKQADYMRGWWNRLTPEEKREKIAGRDPEVVREQGRKKQARRRADPTPQQREMLRAHEMVKRARKQGKLVREPCEVCGAEEVHAHHDDYSKPLEVRWLCPSHHRQVHGMEEAA